MIIKEMTEAIAARNNTTKWVYLMVFFVAFLISGMAYYYVNESLRYSFSLRPDVEINPEFRFRTPSARAWYDVVLNALLLALITATALYFFPKINQKLQEKYPATSSLHRSFIGRYITKASVLVCLILIIISVLYGILYTLGWSIAPLFYSRWDRNYGYHENEALASIWAFLLIGGIVVSAKSIKHSLLALFLGSFLGALLSFLLNDWVHWMDHKSETLFGVFSQVYDAFYWQIKGRRGDVSPESKANLLLATIQWLMMAARWLIFSIMFYVAWKVYREKVLQQNEK